MKQNITPAQLNELNKDQKKKLIKYLFEPETWYRNYSTDSQLLLSIGQMMELLEEYSKTELSLTLSDNGSKLTKSWFIIKNVVDDYGTVEKTLWTTSIDLCNALWEAVKEILGSLE